MTNYRYTAVLATISNSFCDAVLDYAVNRFNVQKVMFLTTCIGFLGQLIIGIFTGIYCTMAAIPYVALHSLLILLGYTCFVKSLKYTPIALVGLVMSSDLFLTFIIDCILGYVKLSFYFVLMLALFIFAITMFAKDSKSDVSNSFKSFKSIGILFVLGQVIFYLTAPYIIKISAAKGANEIAINIGYYLLAIPYFGYYAFSCGNDVAKKNIVSQWWNGFYFLAVIIGILEALYYALETFSLINDAPTIVVAIEQMRIFLLFLLSVIFKTDKFTKQKLLALILGFAAIIGVYLN